MISSTSSTAFTGIILAGGKSSRMGFEKGLAEIQGKQMMSSVLEALKPVCDQLLIISNTDTYQDLGWPVYEDLYKNIGPLGGIHTGLTYTLTDNNLIVACDMPFLSTAVFTQLLGQAPGYEILVPSVQGQWQPLCAYYNKQISKRVEQLIAQKTWKMQQVIRHFHYKEWLAEEAGFDASLFANINSPSDLEQFQKKNKPGL